MRSYTLISFSISEDRMSGGWSVAEHKNVCYHWLLSQPRKKEPHPRPWDDGAGLGGTPLATFFMPDERDPFLGKSLQYLQENIRRAGPAATASYTLIGAILLLGGVGHLIDRWQGTSPWLLLVGLLAGIVVGFYELAKATWKL